MTRSPPPSDESSDPRAARLKADTVVGSLTTLVDQQRSLAAGLDALAEDAPSWRLRRALRGLAGRLESGTPLEEALRADRSIPRPLVVAAEAGRETGRLLPVLQEYQIASEELSRHRWTIYGALSYPLALMLSSVAVVAFLFEWILPQFREVLSGFGVSLGTLPIFLFAISEFLATPTATWVLGLLLVAMLLLAIGVRWSAPLARLFHWVPIVGTTFYWSGMAEFCRWMSVFVRAKTPVAPTFRSMGSLIADPWVGQCARLLAVRMERGERLEDAAASVSGLPLPLRSICRWAKHGDAFPDMLERSARIFAEQARLQAEVLRTALTPIIFVGVAGTASLVMFAILLPLLSLLRALT